MIRIHIGAQIHPLSVIVEMMTVCSMRGHTVGMNIYEDERGPTMQWDRKKNEGKCLYRKYLCSTEKMVFNSDHAQKPLEAPASVVGKPNLI